jgi:hypothetical protein
LLLLVLSLRSLSLLLVMLFVLPLLGNYLGSPVVLSLLVTVIGLLVLLLIVLVLLFCKYFPYVSQFSWPLIVSSF